MKARTRKARLGIVVAGVRWSVVWEPKRKVFVARQWRKRTTKTITAVQFITLVQKHGVLDVDRNQEVFAF